MKTWVFTLILLLIIGTVAVFAYTGMFAQGSKIFERECKPNLVYLSLTEDEDKCKGACYYVYKVTSFELEEHILGFFKCYCDINNCNPK